jgi:hypothetical protein
VNSAGNHSHQVAVQTAVKIQSFIANSQFGNGNLLRLAINVVATYTKVATCDQSNFVALAMPIFVATCDLRNMAIIIATYDNFANNQVHCNLGSSLHLRIIIAT